MKIFSAQTFRFLTDSGEQLSATLDLVEPMMRVERPSPFAGSITPKSLKLSILLIILFPIQLFSLEHVIASQPCRFTDA